MFYTCKADLLNPWCLASFTKHIKRGWAAKGENMKKLTVRDLADIAIVAAVFKELWLTVSDLYRGSTLVFLSLGVWLFSKYSKNYLFNGLIRKDHFFFSILFSISMITIAAELNIVAEAPFFFTWFTTGIGEFASLIVGAIIIGKIGQRIDLTR